MALIPGKLFILADGEARIVPPFTFRQMKEIEESGLLPILDDPSKPKERAAAIFTVVHKVLARNYPNIPLDKMEELLDPGLVGSITLYLFGQPTKPEDRVQGEAVSR